MSEASDQTLTLLKELAILKEGEYPKARCKAGASRKRRKEIGEELKQLASEKKEEGK
jgi:hypothetical protein